MDREAWHAAVLGAAKSWAWLSDWTFLGVVMKMIPIYIKKHAEKGSTIIVVWPALLKSVKWSCVLRNENLLGIRKCFPYVDKCVFNMLLNKEMKYWRNIHEEVKFPEIILLRDNHFQYFSPFQCPFRPFFYLHTTTLGSTLRLGIFLCYASVFAVYVSVYAQWCLILCDHRL